MEKKKNSVNTRELVLSMLMEIYGGKEFDHRLVRQVLDKYDYLSGSEKAFIKRLTEGTLERTIELDYVIGQFSSVKVNKLKPFIRTLLRMSVYQILYMDNVPDSAVCNEAVKLAAAHRFSSLKGFVNGVLRQVSRNKENIAYPDREKEKREYFSVTYSLPLWMVEHFLNAYGEEKAEKIFAGLLTERPVTVRLSERVDEAGKEKLRQQWNEQGITVTPHPYLPSAFVCKKTEGLQNMAGFAQGLITVQDVSSMLVARSAGIEPGMHILDVCAAPGGKSCHAADILGGTGLVLARDVSPAKTALIEENRDRQRLGNLQVQVWDATTEDESREEWADILFCDVPCSGLGVMGRKRDIKYRITEDSLKELVLLQQSILSASWKQVKKGGILMYSTCTINREENEEQVKWFVEHFPFEIVSFTDQLPEQLRQEEQKWGLQLLCGIHETDGFFLCKLRRKS